MYSIIYNYWGVVKLWYCVLVSVVDKLEECF